MTKKICIVGGSSSGFLAALLLARHGHDVTLYERADDIDPMPRTLIVTDRIRNYIGDLAESAVVNEIDKFELYANGHAATTPLSRADLIIERSAVIRALAKEAEAEGVKIELGTKFLDLDTDRKRARLRLRRRGSCSVDVVEPDIVIGADGVFSRVAKAAGWPTQTTVPLMQAIVNLPEDLEPDTARCWFRPHETPFFYWLVPESETRGALGVIGTRRANVRASLDGFLTEKGLEPLEYQSAIIPRYSRWIKVHKRLGETDVYLVGDAAGQVKVSTVGGIVTGFRGALGVVESIQGTRPRELRYLKWELEAHLLVSKVLHRFGEKEYVRLLELLDSGMRRALGERSRDESARLIFDVLRARPALALLALQAMSRGLLARSSS